MDRGYRVAVVGATGAVGTNMIEMLEKDYIADQGIDSIGFKAISWENLCLQRSHFGHSRINYDLIYWSRFGLYLVLAAVSPSNLPQKRLKAVRS